MTNDGVEPFLRAFLASPPRVGRKRTRSHWDCGESDGAPEAMCSAAGQDAGDGRFVDLEAGRSSGSEAGDEDEDDDEAGSLDGFVVKNEKKPSSVSLLGMAFNLLPEPALSAAAKDCPG